MNPKLSDSSDNAPYFLILVLDLLQTSLSQLRRPTCFSTIDAIKIASAMRMVTLTSGHRRIVKCIAHGSPLQPRRLLLVPASQTGINGLGPRIYRRGLKTVKTIPLQNLSQGIILSEPLENLEDEPTYPTVVQQARQHMRSFENCVLLTRVGSFYEVGSRINMSYTCIHVSIFMMELISFNNGWVMISSISNKLRNMGRY